MASLTSWPPAHYIGKIMRILAYTLATFSLLVGLYWFKSKVLKVDLIPGHSTPILHNIFFK
jgi:hypothetical protein